MRTPRPKAIALAAIIGVLASAPAMAFAQQEQVQAAAEVTVDLSGLNRGSRREPLAQTSDTRQLIAVGVATVGAGLTCLGLHIKRNQ